MFPFSSWILQKFFQLFNKSNFENSLFGRSTSSLSLLLEIEFLKLTLAKEKLETAFWLFGISKSLFSFFSTTLSV